MAIPFKAGLTPQQKQSIENLVSSGRQFNDIDAQNFAYATGQNAGNFRGMTGSQALQKLAPARPGEIPTDSLSPTLAQGGSAFSPDSFSRMLVNNTGSDIEKYIGGYLANERERLSEEMKLAQKRKDDASVLLEGELGNRFDRNAELRKAQELAGLADKERALNDILGQMNDAALAFQNGKRALIGESSTMKLLTGKEALLADQYNAQQTWLAGKAAIVEGNLDRANRLVGQYFDNALADRDDRINNLKTLFDLANDKVINLSKDEKDIINSQIGLLSDINTRQQKEKNDIRDLMLDKTVSAVWDKAGVDMSMSYDEIIKKLLPHIVAERKRQESIKSVGSGSVANNTKFFNAAKDGVSQLQKGEPWGTVWNRIRLQFPNVSNEDIDTALGGRAGDILAPGMEGPVRPGSGWAASGAYETFKQGQYKETTPTINEQEAGVWAWLASEEVTNLSDEEKKQEIMANGFDPSKFNIY